MSWPEKTYIIPNFRRPCWLRRPLLSITLTSIPCSRIISLSPAPFECQFIIPSQNWWWKTWHDSMAIHTAERSAKMADYYRPAMKMDLWDCSIRPPKIYCEYFGAIKPLSIGMYSRRTIWILSAFRTIEQWNCGIFRRRKLCKRTKSTRTMCELVVPVRLAQMCFCQVRLDRQLND